MQPTFDGGKFEAAIGQKFKRLFRGMAIRIQHRLARAQRNNWLVPGNGFRGSSNNFAPSTWILIMPTRLF